MAARSRRRSNLADALPAIYERLYGAYGPQDWWPGETPFEVMVGAVLTQNTAWRNVEQAIANLKARDLLSLERIQRLPAATLATHIRPAGYYNVKSRRLKNLCAWLTAAGGIAALRDLPTAELRAALLGVNGVGPETADDILLYACGRPVFVIDAYTRRLFSRMRLIRGDEDYEDLRGRFEAALNPDPELLGEFHALIVRHAKEKCGAQPECRHCAVEAPLN